MHERDGAIVAVAVKGADGGAAFRGESAGYGRDRGRGMVGIKGGDRKDGG